MLCIKSGHESQCGERTYPSREERSFPSPDDTAIYGTDLPGFEIVWNEFK